MIRTITQRCPDWLFEVKNQSGKILRLNKSLPMEKVMERLK